MPTFREQYPAEYNAWTTVKLACYHPGNLLYPEYGAKGRTMCARWLNSPETFVADMGPKPTTRRHYIRLHDSETEYKPDSCSWEPVLTQCRLRRANKRVRSGVKGVYTATEGKSWFARISVDGKIIHLGSYESIPEALAARQAGEMHYWGFTTP